MTNPKLLNKRAIVLKRCSTDSQIATSINNQNISVEKTIADNNITVVKEFDLPGVTGSIPGARQDINQILDLKKGGLDFDLLILPNTDRFTRAGQGHGHRILYDLEGEQIVVYFVAENLFSDDRMHRMVLSFMFDAAQQTAISISRGATLGNTNSFLEGRMPHSKTPIYGLDRMYSVDGKDIHRIRALADGTQLMLDPQGETVIRKFGQNIKGKAPEHYIKQKNEHVRLVPGDPKHVAIVHLIFRLVHIERRSFHSIAKQLNDAGIFSPRGKEWDGIGIKHIAWNRTYVGILRHGGETSAIYYKSAKGSPAPSDIGPKELRDQDRPRSRHRPYDEWLLREDPALQNFLPKDIYEIARPRIEEHMRQEGLVQPSAPLSKDRHRNSDFFLKNILTSKQGGYRMTGKRSGRHGEKRYYRVAKGQRCPKTNDIFNRAVNATSLEQEMLRILKEILLNKPDLADALRQVALEHAKSQQTTDDRPNLEKSLLKKQKQIAAGLENLSGDSELDRPIEAKLAEYRSEVARLATLLRATPKPAAPIDIDASVEHLVSQLSDFGSHLDEKGKAIIHEMFGLLIHRMEADLVTKETEVTLAIPSWIGSALNTISMMGLDKAFAWKISNETHQENAVILAEFLCTATGHRHVCYDCRRVRRAA